MFKESINRERRVKALPPLLANQIAAGEVVERPASIVKELVENSIDAGATNIEIRIERGGMQTIVITDDGCGIMQEDLSLAIMPHATSKIYSLDELENLQTLGFRGEALASIAAVSRFLLKSHSQNHSDTLTDTGAWQIEVEGKDHAPIIKPARLSKGTRIEACDLFFNIPARRKFLKSENTEFSHIEEGVRKLALSHLEIAFKLYHNNKLIFNLEIDTPEKRLDVLCGKGFSEKSQLIQVEKSGFSLEGWLVQPGHLKRYGEPQYFYVNGRPIRDKLMMHALKEGYRDVIYGDHQPQYILFLELDPKAVDFNVHPSKLEVRFHEGRLLHDFVLSEVKKALARQPDEICHDKFSATRADIATGEVFTAQQDFKQAHTSSHFLKQEHFSNAGSLSSPQAMPLFAEASSLIATPASSSQADDFPVTDHAHQSKDRSLENFLVTAISENKAEPQHIQAQIKVLRFGQAICQLKGLFILAEADEGLIIIDMHAAHERVLYERLKLSWQQQKLERQILLLPQPIELSRQEEAVFKDQQEKFISMGFLIDEWTDQKIMVREVPLILANVNLDKFMHGVLKDLELLGSSNETEKYLDHILAEIACHSAVQAHQTLSLSAMNQLLRDMEITPNIDYCNHGRPTWKLFKTAELSRFFLRGR